MIAALRKGWCPGALRPMMARDGLLVRLRITGGHVEAPTAHALAALAHRFGNGLFDLSARGNLQMRGVDPTRLGPLLEALAALDLLDTDAGAEAVRNVILSPLAGLGQRRDASGLARALEGRLVADRALHALPAKFCFLIDDGGAPSLAGIAADIRFELHRDDAGRERVWIGLGGTKARALWVAVRDWGDMVEAAVSIAHTFLALIAAHEPAPRRMGALLHRLSAEDATRAFGGPVDAPPDGVAAVESPPVGSRDAAGVSYLGLAVPFGRLDHTMLAAACTLAETRGIGILRLTPWRCLMLPGVTPIDDLEPYRALGFIVDSADPRLRIAACVGMAGCERGSTPTAADASAWADVVGALAGHGIALHVSGCAKGCAHGAPAPFTLVGRDGLYDLVVRGKASDVPLQRGLGLDGVRDALRALA